MGFPDHIARTVDLAHPPETVWAALTTAEGLASWFGHEAKIDLRVGGGGWMRWPDGDTAEMRVERLEAPAVFGFTWRIHGLPASDPRRTYVEFTLERTPAGTRLQLREQGFAQLDDAEHRFGHGAHTEGWTHELGELVAHLDGT